MKQDCACDLCGLDVGIKPFCLESAGKRLKFCCDGCLGIYQMLHETESPVTHVTPVTPVTHVTHVTPVTPNDTQSSKGEMP